MPTTAQIQSVLSISGEYSLITGAATIADTSNYASIGVVSPDTVKILLYIQDSAGNLFYKNAGYDAADFSAPDLEPLAGTDTYSFTMPTDITGAYMTGQYTINEKVQVVQDTETTEAYKALYQNVVASCNGIVPKVTGDVSYNTAEVSVTDSTNYKTWTALANTLTLYPPQQSEQVSQSSTFGGSPATLTYEPPSGQYPYTGKWGWKLSTEYTYTDILTSASTTCLIAAQGYFDVIQSQLCNVLCVLKKYRAQVFQLTANSQVQGALAKKNLLEAEGEYMLAFAAERCGRPQTEIDGYVAVIYELIGVDPNSDCDCGCGDGTSQPLVPTSIINGADGTDGTVIYSGTTVPSNGTGVVGDYYIRTTNGFLYKKTGATTWTYLLTMIGSSGAAGVSGTSLLFSNFADSPTVTTSWETWAAKTATTTFGTDAENLVNDGDSLRIVVEFVCSAPTGQDTRIRLNASVNLAGVNSGFYASNINFIRYEICISKLTDTTATVAGQILFSSDNGFTWATVNELSIKKATIALANTTTTNNVITAEADSDAAGDVVCQYMTVEILKQLQ